MLTRYILLPSFKVAHLLSQASGTNPLIAILVIFSFLVLYHFIGVQIEMLIWNHTFTHVVDLLALLIAALLSVQVVQVCAVSHMIALHKARGLNVDEDAD